MFKKVVNQDSGCSIIINFYDDNDLPVVPSTVNYKITDINSLTLLLPVTAIPVNLLGTSIAIEIDSTINALINQKLELEPKVFTVIYTFFNGTAIVTRTDEFQYSVLRLYGEITEGLAL